MHSVWQTELRLSQRALRTSCRQCTERCRSPKRRFHQGRALRSSQGVGSDGNSVPGPPPTGEKKDTISNHTSIRDAPGLPQILPSASQIAHQIVPETQDAEDTISEPAINYYGSLSRRRLRSRSMREVSEPSSTIPQWFIEHNVNTWAEQSNMEEADERMKLLDSPADGDGPGPNSHGSNPQEHSSSPEGTTSRSDQYQGGPTTLAAIDMSRLPSVISKEYFMSVDQWREILNATKGMLRAPDGKEHVNEPAIATSALLLNYLGKDGDVFLDTIILKLVQQTASDIISIDAQDIAELISSSKQRLEVLSEGRMLGYEVFTEAYSGTLRNAETTIFESPEEFDEEAQDMGPFDIPSASNMAGMPVVIGKPITIDLNGLFGPQQNSRRPDQSMFPKQFFSNMFQNSIPKGKPPSIFAALVENVLSALPERQKRFSNVETEKVKDQRESDSIPLRSPQDSTIIHVKDLKAIQEYPVGKQFIAELLDQVQRRRLLGESILVVGTDCAREHSDVQPSRIDEIQRNGSDEMARTIVITPSHPNEMKHQLRLIRDRRWRIATINLRHLWQTLKYKSENNLVRLEPGFWRTNFMKRFHVEDQKVLEQHIWTFSYVQRLAACIQGADFDLRIAEDASTNREDKDELKKFFPFISLAVSQLTNSDKSKARWAEKQTKTSKASGSSHDKTEEDVRLDKIRASANKYEKRLMGGVIQADKISTTFEDVHVPVETIDAIQTLTTLSLVRPEAFRYGVLASDKIPGLLLYGPPGTGKTLLAKAVAKESGATVLEVSAADVNDMYVGEGEKNVKALFSLAKKLSPCVVFLDEADAMFRARSEQGRRVSHRELLNQFLKEWDGMSNDSGSAFIMVATNRPGDLDEAVLRRLPRRLLVDLPTEQDRLEILKIHLRNEILANDVDLSGIAKKTPFYSGSDLKNTAVAAALNAVREENDLAKKHTGKEPFVFPEKRTLTAKHFESALEEISASISEDMNSLREIKKFDEQYGDKRGKKRRTPKWGFRTAKEANEVLDTVKVRS